VSLFADWHNHRTGPVPFIHVQRRRRALTMKVTPARSPRSAGTQRVRPFKGFSHRSSSGPEALVTPRGSGGSQPSLNRWPASCRWRARLALPHFVQGVRAPFTPRGSGGSQPSLNR